MFLSKMGTCKLKEIWLQDEKYREWLGVASNDFEATCMVYRKTSKLGTMGIMAVESYLKSEKHRLYAGIRKNTAPMESSVSAATISSAPAGSQTGNVGPYDTAVASVQPGVFVKSLTATLRAEGLWVLHLSQHNIHTLFKEMFPDSEHVKTFTCER